VEVAKHAENLPEDLRGRLLELEENVMTNRFNTQSDYYRYYSYMYQATHGRAARVVRGEFFERHCLALT
jgi:hypothetical protein